jgi:hypothetical protein
MARSRRRHHSERLKAKRAPWHWGRDLRGNKRAIGKAVKTPCPCSNSGCCGNYRNVMGETRQERNAAAKMKEQTEG